MSAACSASARARAGADPGPACYGQGGTEPTVTDANVVLGRLDPDYFLGGEMTLDAARAHEAVAALGATLGLTAVETARAILETAAENMADAIRLMTVERGIDHRDYALIAFGGAGPLHAVDVAAPLEMKKVVVPPHPGLCSALGTLLTDLRVDRARTVNHRSDSADLDVLNGQLRALAQARRWRSSSARGSKARRGSPATSACATLARTSASWCSSRLWSWTTTASRGRWRASTASTRSFTATRSATRSSR